MRKAKALLVLLSCMLVMTGCWDKVELEDRAFVLAIGVDKAEVPTTDEVAEARDKYLFTFVNPDTAKAEEGKVLDFVTFQVQAPSYTIGITRLLQSFAQFHSYEHTKVLIFGRELMEDPVLLKSMLDNFARGHQFNISMYVFTTHNKAADIFQAKLKMKSLLAYYITGIADNEKYASRVGKLTLLDFMRQVLDNDGDAVIPSLDLHENGLTSSYLAMIKGYKYIGHMDAKETVAWKWLNGEAKGGVIQIQDGDIPVPFNYSTFKRRIYLDKIEGNKIYITYDMETEGSIEEYILGKKLLYRDKIQQLERELEQIIVKDSMYLVKKMKEEYKVDLLGIRDFLRKFHPMVYEEVMKDFENNFQDNIIINVKAEVKIRRVGKTE